MTALRSIETDRFRKALGRVPAADMSAAPTLEWLKIERLRIDPAYQREIGKRGAANVLAIARDFDWSKFSPVIVAPTGGAYARIDGLAKHLTRTPAAIGVALELLDRYGAVEFTGDGDKRAVRITKAMLP